MSLRFRPLRQILPQNPDRGGDDNNPDNRVVGPGAQAAFLSSWIKTVHARDLIDSSLNRTV